jgi:hypothetical protein
MNTVHHIVLPELTGAENWTDWFFAVKQQASLRDVWKYVDPTQKERILIPEPPLLEKLYFTSSPATPSTSASDDGMPPAGNTANTAATRRREEASTLSAGTARQPSDFELQAFDTARAEAIRIQSDYITISSAILVATYARYQVYPLPHPGAYEVLQALYKQLWTLDQYHRENCVRAEFERLRKGQNNQNIDLWLLAWSKLLLDVTIDPGIIYANLNERTLARHFINAIAPSNTVAFSYLKNKELNGKILSLSTCIETVQHMREY